MDYIEISEISDCKRNSIYEEIIPLISNEEIIFQFQKTPYLSWQHLIFIPLNPSVQLS